MLLCLVVSAVLMLAAIVFARRGVRVSPTIGVAVVVIIVCGAAFGLGGYVIREVNSPTIQVLVKYLRNLPTWLIVIYSCLILVRRYRRVRNSYRLRRLLELGPYIMVSTFVVALSLDLVAGVPVLDVERNLPWWMLPYNAALLLPVSFYGVLTASIFILALWEQRPFSGLRQRGVTDLQNVCGFLIMSSLSLLTVVTMYWYTVRVLGSAQEIIEYAQPMARLQLALISVAAISALIGFVCDYTRDEAEQLMDRLAAVAEPVCDLTELLASAPIVRLRCNVPYLLLHQAARPSHQGGLGLSDQDKDSADEAFRAGLLLHESRSGNANEDATSAGGIREQDLLQLARLCDQEYSDPEAALIMHGTHEPTESAADMLPAEFSVREQGFRESGNGLYRVMAFCSDLMDPGSSARGLSSSDEWQQLAALALAESRTLPAVKSKRLLAGEDVSERVADAHTLAKAKLEIHRGELEDLG